MNQKGVSITAVVFIIVILSFMGVIFVSLLTTGTEESVVEYDSSRALYIAEGGAEAAIGYAKQTPPGTYWCWNNGYIDKLLGDGNYNLEVLQYDTPAYTGGPDFPVSMCIRNPAGVTNAARTIFATLTCQNAVAPFNFGLELYDENPAVAPPVSATTYKVSDKTVVLRYTVPNPGAYLQNYTCSGNSCSQMTYTVRVTNEVNCANGGSYSITISHPDEIGFNASSRRSVISLGKMNDSRREIFVAFKRP